MRPVDNPLDYTGVIIGGIIGAISALLPSALLLVYEQRRWRDDRKLQRFKDKKAYLEARFAKISEILPAAIAKNKYPTDLLSLLATCPDSVWDAVHAFTADPDKDEKKAREAWIKVAAVMAKELRKIELLIDDLVR